MSDGAAGSINAKSGWLVQQGGGDRALLEGFGFVASNVASADCRTDVAIVGTLRVDQSGIPLDVVPINTEPRHVPEWTFRLPIGEEGVDGRYDLHGGMISVTDHSADSWTIRIVDPDESCIFISPSFAEPDRCSSDPLEVLITVLGQIGGAQVGDPVSHPSQVDSQTGVPLCVFEPGDPVRQDSLNR